jgi:Domain of unknown function (DUF4167)
MIPGATWRTSHRLNVHQEIRIEMSYRDFKGIMRPGQNKRRGRNPNNPNNPNNPGNPNRPRGPHRSQTFDSSGPSVKIRGNAYQVFERYVALAREAALSGDRIAAENLYQHAEHYFRIMNANGEGHQQGAPRPMTPADTEMMGHEGEGAEQPHYQHQPQPPMPQHGAPQPDRPSAPPEAPPRSEAPRHDPQQQPAMDQGPPGDPIGG